MTPRGVHTNLTKKFAGSLLRGQSPPPGDRRYLLLHGGGIGQKFFIEGRTGILLTLGHCLGGLAATVGDGKGVADGDRR